jgi:hypothetical protein
MKIDYKNLVTTVPQFSIKKGTSISNILNFIFSNLRYFNQIEFASHYNENLFTQDLVLMLDHIASKSYAPFKFQHQIIDHINNLSNLSRSLDIGVYSNSSNAPILLGEAKRLPLPKKRRREYVIGKKISGGIERFKREVHAKGHKISFMIGYVEKNDFKYWEKEINNWIKKLALGKKTKNLWNSKDVLKKVTSNTNKIKCRLISNNKTINNNIKIHHFWVYIKYKKIPITKVNDNITT